MHNIYLSKHVTGFLPIGKNMTRRGQWKEPYCPRCQYPVENASHLLRCPSTSARKIVRSSSSKFHSWLESVDTEPSLMTLILEITSSYIHDIHVQPQVYHPPPIQHQLRLGWSHFMQGRIHTSFQSYMTNHYSSIASKRSPTAWAAVLIQKIWSLYHFPQWENRNKYVHNLDRVTESTRERINLQTSLTNAYTSENIHNLLAADKHLLEKPFVQLKKLPNNIYQFQ